VGFGRRAVIPTASFMLKSQPNRLTHPITYHWINMNSWCCVMGPSSDNATAKKKKRVSYISSDSDAGDSCHSFNREIGYPSAQVNDTVVDL
jgi:hypothetical protein